MKNDDRESVQVEDLLKLQGRITRALYAAGRDALIRHKREGLPIVVWRDGKTVKVPAEDIAIPPERADASLP